MRALSVSLMTFLGLQHRASRICCHSFSSASVSMRQFHGLGGKTKSLGWIQRGGANHPHQVSESSMSPRFSTKSNVESGVSQEIREKAQESLSIAGPSVLHNFGGLSYRPTSIVETSPYRVIFVLGGPGAGKGTQSELLLENYPCVHLSAGELLRAETKKEDSPHAALISECLVAGKIVPVEISLSLLQAAMAEAQADQGNSLLFLVDGFPRNFDNLEGWTRCMTEDIAAVWGVLFYQCPLEVLEERILERAKESGRSDDNLESLRKRFRTFEKDTMPVIDALRVIQESTLLQVKDIAGNQSLEDVWRSTQEAMNDFLRNDILAANSKLIQAAIDDDLESYTNMLGENLLQDSESSTDLASKLLAEEELLSLDDIIRAEIDIATGKTATVKYSYQVGDSVLEDTREWAFCGKDGWRNVGLTRISKPS